MAAEPGKLDDPDVWGSGKIAAERPQDVMSDTGALKSRTAYWWRVEVWNEVGKCVFVIRRQARDSVRSLRMADALNHDSYDLGVVAMSMFRGSFWVKIGIVRVRLYASVFIIPYTLCDYTNDLCSINKKIWPLCERCLDFVAA